MRGRHHQLTHELDEGNQRLLTFSPVVGMYVLPTVLTVGAIFKDTALREQCVIESIWAVSIAEPN